MPTLVDVQWKKEKNNKMTKFDYKKWVTENKHGKPLYEQGVADFQEDAPADYIAEQTGSGTGSGTGGPTPTGSGTLTQCYWCDCDADPTNCSGTMVPINYSNISNPSSTTQYAQGYCGYNQGSTSGYHTYTPNWQWWTNLNAQCTASGSAGTGSADWWCTGTGTTGPSCIQSSNIPSGVTSGPHPDQATCQTACGTTPTGSTACNLMPTSPCAQTHFGPSANNFAPYMVRQSCATFQSNKVRNIQQAYALAVATGNNGTQGNPVYNTSTTYTYNQIRQIANTLFGTGGAGQPQKGQFKRKAAKAGWCQCMQNSGCCTTNENINENKGGGCGCGKPKPPKKKLTNSFVK